MAGVGVRKHKGLWIDKFGRTLPRDATLIKTVSKEQAKINKEKGVLRVENPDVAKDIRSGSFVFGGISRLAAKHRTNKRFKDKQKTA